MQTKEPFYAAVASIGLLEAFFDRRLLSPYFLVLAHKVLQEPDRWNRFFREVRRRDGDVFIVVDNSLIELDEPLEEDELFIAAGIVKADVIVLPDVFEDAGATVAYSEDAAEALNKRIKKSKAKKKPRLMGVTQGKTRKEILECGDSLAAIENVNFLAVPRITVDHLGSRTPVSKLLWEKHELPIHLLGFSKDLKDDVLTTRLEGIVGIDSSMPVSWGYNEKPLTLDSVTKHRHRPPNYLELEEEDYKEQMAVNIMEVWTWL